jgi:TonB-linked SusC/RagA family outer membrane protein
MNMYSQISIDVQNKPIKEILKQIEKSSSYRFFYSEDLKDLDKSASLTLSNASVEKTLEVLLKGTQIAFNKQSSDIVLLFPKGANPTAADDNAKVKAISGTVTDTNGEPIIGANISEKGTQNGTASDVEGKFSLQVNPDAVLVISYIGYTTQEIAVGNQTSLNITLSEDNLALDEVVVVGYGTQKKTHLLGSVSQVQAKEIEKVSTGRMGNALQGRLAGVSISQSSGGRPGNSSDIIVRARGTWNSTSPLFVIDGVARDQTAFDNLDPSLVETFSVLKDAAAAAIYGSRAANGVVMVTTKRGQIGKPLINYSGSYGIGSFTKVPERETMEQRFAMINDHQLEFADFFKETAKANAYLNGQNASGGYVNNRVMTDDEMQMYRERGAVDQLKEAYSTPVTTNHAINVSGGTEKVKYFAGASFYDEKGAFKTISYRKNNIRGNVTADLNKYWKAGIELATTWDEDKSPVGSGGADVNRGDDKLRFLWGTLMRSSTLNPAKVDGKYTRQYVNNWAGGGENGVAIAEGAAGDITKNNLNTEYTASLQWKAPWVEGLSARASFNQRWRNSQNKTWETPYEQYNLKMAGTNGHFFTNEILSSAGTKYGKEGKPSLKQSAERWSDYQLNVMVNYDRTFDKHEISALVGYEQAEASWSGFSASKYYYTVSMPYFDLGPGDVDNNGNAGNNYSISGTDSESARLSYFGRLDYTYAGKYLAEFSFRRDASIKFHPDHRWGFFPSGSLAWRMGEESFIKDNFTWLSNMKIRGSVGLTGNDGGDDLAAWQWQDKMRQTTGYYWGGSTGTQGLTAGDLVNPWITWEKSLNYDAGLEMGFLKNMFTFGLDYFFRHTYDILGSQTADIPDTFGASLASSNYGIVDSYGIELEIGFNKQINKDLSVWAKGNFGWADNKLKKFAESGVAAHLSRIGTNWDRRVGYVTDGIVRSIENLGNNQYRVYTSTGNQYVVPGNGYVGWSDMDITANHFLSMRPGMVFYRDMGSVSGIDANNNPVYSNVLDGRVTDDQADRRWIINHYNPPYNYGLLLGGKWKGFSLEVFLNGLAGHQTFLGMDSLGGDGTIDDTSFGFWAADHYSQFNNPNGMMPAPTNWWGKNGQGSNTAYTDGYIDFWVRDASFIRLKNITLSYDLPKTQLKKIGVEGLNIFLTADNVALLYNPLKVADPELAGGFNSLSASQAASPESPIMAYPLMRTVNIGLNLTF